MLNLFDANNEKIGEREERWAYSIDDAGRECLLIATRTNVFSRRIQSFREQNGIIKARGIWNEIL